MLRTVSMMVISLIALAVTPQAFAQAPSIAVPPVTNAEINRGAAEATTNAAAPMTQRKGEKADKDKPAPEPESTPSDKAEPSAGKNLVRPTGQ